MSTASINCPGNEDQITRHFHALVEYIMHATEEKTNIYTDPGTWVNINHWVLTRFTARQDGTARPVVQQDPAWQDEQKRRFPSGTASKQYYAQNAYNGGCVSLQARNSAT